MLHIISIDRYYNPLTIIRLYLHDTMILHGYYVHPLPFCEYV